MFGERMGREFYEEAQHSQPLASLTSPCQINLTFFFKKWMLTAGYLRGVWVRVQ